MSHTPQIRENTRKLYQAIRDEYAKMCEKKVKGVQVYSEDYILMMVADKFFRSPRTVENIIYYRVPEPEPPFVQSTLF